MKRIVVAGVSGSGKTSVGRLLAARTDRPFLDADDFHPPENVAKMRAGRPLDDRDRSGWLERLGNELAGRDRLVLACSALKHAYRDRLRELAGDLVFVLLHVDPAELRRRMEQREHFMPPGLLESQLATLEPGDDLVVVDNEGAPEETVAEIVRRLESQDSSSSIR